MPAQPPWLTLGFIGVQIGGGALLTTRSTLNLVIGAGLSAAWSDNPANGSTDLTLSAGASAPTPYLPITHASSSKQIVCSAGTQPVDADSTAGSFDLVMPVVADAADGQVVVVKDLAASWGTHAVGVTVESGVHIEDPQNPGTYVTGGTLALVAVNGGGASWRLCVARNQWSLA